MNGSRMEQVQVTVAPGYEPLASVFEQAHEGLTVSGAALSVAVDGREVVNLVAGQAKPNVPWTVDTPAVLMSVTKAFAALCIAILTDRGLVDPDERVSTYWPEFAQNGKESTTVRQVLTHRAGLLGWPDAGKELGWGGKGYQDLDLIAARLAAAAPSWAPGTNHGYHAVSFGWLTGEIVRRVTGRTLGTFFHDEVAVPLGLETGVGVGPEVAALVAAVDSTGMDRIPFPFSLLLKPVFTKMRTPDNMLGIAFLGDGTRSVMDGVGSALDDPEFLKAELPSSNGVSSAHDLARLFAMLANRGSLDGVTILTPETCDRFAAHELREADCVMAGTLPFPLNRLLRERTTLTRALGYQLNNPPKTFGPTPSAYGVEGAGGQMAFCDPSRGVSFGFVRSGLQMSPKPLPELVASLYSCLPA